MWSILLYSILTERKSPEGVSVGWPWHIWKQWVLSRYGQHTLRVSATAPYMQAHSADYSAYTQCVPCAISYALWLQHQELPGIPKFLSSCTPLQNSISHCPLSFFLHLHVPSASWKTLQTNLTTLLIPTPPQTRHCFYSLIHGGWHCHIFILEARNFSIIFLQ